MSYPSPYPFNPSSAAYGPTPPPPPKIFIGFELSAQGVDRETGSTFEVFPPHDHVYVLGIRVLNDKHVWSFLKISANVSLVDGPIDVAMWNPEHAQPNHVTESKVTENNAAPPKSIDYVECSGWGVISRQLPLLFQARPDFQSELDHGKLRGFVVGIPALQGSHRG